MPGSYVVPEAYRAKWGQYLPHQRLKKKNGSALESLSSSSVLAAAEDRTLLMGDHQSLRAVKLYQPK